MSQDVDGEAMEDYQDNSEQEALEVEDVALEKAAFFTLNLVCLVSFLFFGNIKGISGQGILSEG